jgi:hypothetical protein
MVLSIEGLDIPMPLAPCPDAMSLFKQLGVAYGVHDKVVEYLVDVVRLEHIFDFVHLFTDYQAVGEFVGKIGLDEPELPLQTARLRRAWKAARGNSDNADTISVSTINGTPIRSLILADCRRPMAGYNEDVVVARIIFEKVREADD